MPASPQLRLYRIPFSTNVERIALALAHKGIPVEYVDVDPDDRSPVVEVSGQELVPVLVDGDLVLSDSPVILDHLEQRFPERPLYPVDEARRAGGDLRRLVQPRLEARAEPDRRRGGEGESRPRPDRELERRIAAALPLFESLLADRDYLFGDELTAADVMAFPFLKYAVLWDEGDEHRFHEILRDAMPLGDRRPRLEAWIRRMDELPRA